MATGYEEFETKMRKTSENLSTNLASVRAGRANAAVLDQITVDYYGTPTPIQQVASISTPDPRSLLITPWDKSTLKGIEKAIMASELGIGSCWINQLKYICDEEDIRPRLDALRIPGDHIVWGMAALGYPAKPVPAEGAPRKSEVVYID